MNKFILYTILILISYTGIQAQEKTETASSILDSAFKQAQNENKNVFIIFQASWCKWCKKMDASMNKPSVKKLFTDNYIIKHLVVQEAKDKKHLENHGADLILKKFGGDKNGIPFWLIFDKDSNLLADSKIVEGKLVLKGEGQNIGYPGTQEEIEAFIYKLKKTSNLTDEELALIAYQFKQNN